MKLVSMLIDDKGDVIEQAVREDGVSLDTFTQTLRHGMKQVYWQETDGTFGGQFQAFGPKLQVTPFKMQESIRRVTDGRGCTDNDIKNVIALGRARSINIGGKEYTVAEIANAIKVAEMFAYHRYGAEWAIVTGIVPASESV